MKYPISITKTQQTRLSEVDFDNIPFGRIFSDHMFLADYRGGEWQDMRIVPFGHFTMHPATMALHYGQSIFEGAKAAKRSDGTPVLFRPEQHAKRINASAHRMMMPAFPEDAFLEAMHLLIGMDAQWIPPAEGSALYIRPFMFATDEFIGVRPSETYRFVIFTGPVGPYYTRPIRLKVEQQYVRAFPGGTGEAKCAGNYAASLRPAHEAQEQGFDQVMWMGGPDMKTIQEVGTMNIFFVLDGTVVTPETDGSILKGITRDSLLTLFRDKGYRVEVRQVSIDEIVAAAEGGTLEECFGTGTAAVVSHVMEIQHGERILRLPDMDQRKIGTFAKEYIDGLRFGRIEDTYDWTVPVETPAEVA